MKGDSMRETHIQRPSPGTSSHPVRHRALLAALVIVSGGIIAFLVGSLPGLATATSSHATFLTYVAVFSPSLITMIVLLLGFIVFWTGIDSGWWKLRSSGWDARNKAFSTAMERKREAKDSTTRTLLVSTVHHPRTRNLDVDTLRQKRKQRFYQGREYKGKIHQVNLSLLNSSTLSPGTASSENGELSHLDNMYDYIPTDYPSFSTRAESWEEIVTPSVVTTSLSADEAGISLKNSDIEPALKEVQDAVETKAEPTTPVCIYLLKEITVEVQSAEGTKRSVQLKRKRRDDGKYTERELLAYLASRRGEPIAREKLLEAIFGYGLSDDKYSMTNLTGQFNKCTQFLRQDINKVATELGIPSLTIISSARDEWRLLTEECQVIDLEEVERQYKRIEGVSREDCLKPDVQTACQTLIDAYSGDFLETSIEDIVREGGDNWVDNWMRQPYTQYRTKFFQALWYRAEFWRIRGDLSSDTSEREQTLQRNWYELAAKLYERYALHVATDYTNESAMLFDLEIKERISLGERALRAGLDMYAATKNTQAGDTLYLSFARRMETLTQGQWKPRNDTIEAWKKMKEQTKSHRFAPRVTPHEMEGEE